MRAGSHYARRFLAQRSTRRRLRRATDALHLAFVGGFAAYARLLVGEHVEQLYVDLDARGRALGVGRRFGAVLDDLVVLVVDVLEGVLDELGAGAGVVARAVHANGDAHGLGLQRILRPPWRAVGVADALDALFERAAFLAEQ